MNYIFYKESDNSIVGIRVHTHPLDEYQITNILLTMEDQLGETILSATVEAVVVDDYENRYLGFNPESNSLIINDNYTPPPEPEPEPQPEPEFPAEE